MLMRKDAHVLRKASEFEFEGQRKKRGKKCMKGECMKISLSNEDVLWQQSGSLSQG